MKTYCFKGRDIETMTADEVREAYRVVVETVERDRECHRQAQELQREMDEIQTTLANRVRG